MRGIRRKADLAMRGECVNLTLRDSPADGLRRCTLKSR